MLAACSTTSNLPEDEYLYTGIKEIKIDGKTGTLAEQTVLEEVEGALAYAPNNSLFGSSSMRTPFPVGLWVYNSMGGKEHKGISKWFFNVFAATPRTIGMAAPLTRTKVAQNVLQNYGYFQGKIDYRLIQGKNPRTQKIAYDIHLGQAYQYDSIRYDFPEDKDSIIQASAENSFIGKGKQFSVADLLSEKSRLASEFHNNGYYYYRPDYINYLADTVSNRGKVTLLVAQDKDVPEKAAHTWKYGFVSAYIRKSTSTIGNRQTQNGRQGTGTTNRQGTYDDTLFMKRLTLAYQGKVVPIKPRVMFRNFKFWTGRTYSEERVSNTVTALGNMGIFTGVNFTFTPHDTTDTCSILDVRLETTMDKLIDSEVELNFSQKSNSQIGPDAAITFSRRNAFRYGETFSVKLRGAYFWQTRNRSRDANEMDTYQWGTDVSLSYPWTVFPTLADKITKYPTSTKFGTSFTRENVAGFYRINRMSVGVDYKYQTSKYETHTFTPIQITLSDLRHLSGDYDTNQNATVMGYLTDEYIPAIQYAYTFDNSSNKALGVTTNFSATVKESGNLISGVQTVFGKSFNTKHKGFGFDDYSQFLKATFELRNKFKLTQRSCVATRALLGMLYSYGNSESTPASEWYYIGGANSVRAFGARTLGAGATPYPYGGRDVYLYHGGDMRVEANAEYRFPLFGDVYGAFFVDAGNVWRLQDTQSSTGAVQNDQSYVTKFSFSNLLDQMALGTGLGFRYDMEFLVLRFDVGVAIHAPYETGKSGYYNIPRFFADGVAFHFAVGYPF